MRLRLLEKTRTAPISVEWTVPYEQTEFHIGVHNLPISRAGAWMKEFAIYRAKPGREQLRTILARLNEEKETLVVLNHPYWDAESIGPAQHRQTFAQFLDSFLPFLHAIELNGMRSIRENREVLRLPRPSTGRCFQRRPPWV